MAKGAAGSERPQRTKEHVNASKSYNYIEKFFIDKWHVVERPVADYGYDVVVTTHDSRGYPEGGDIRIQLKASDEFDRVWKGSAIAYPVSVQHYNLWRAELMPVFLVLYEADHHRAYWVYIQNYFSDPAKVPKANAQSVTVRVPVANEFTAETVEYARGRKAAVLTAVEGRVTHDG